MLVALLGTNDEDQQNPSHQLDIVDLPDPATKSVRSYLVDPSTHVIHEITAVKCPLALDDCYQSFVVGGQYVVQNGTLHTITPVDPLFWFLLDERLPKTDATNTVDDRSSSDQWQPLPQVLSQFDPTLLQCLYGPPQETGDDSPPLQLQHLYTEMSLGDTDTFVKFSVPLALTWLDRKYQSIAHILGRQFQVDERRNAHHRMARGQGGAFLDGFTVASFSNNDENETNVADPNPARDSIDSEAHTKVSAQRNEALVERAKEAAIQIVCNYLSPSWRLCFLQHLKLDPSSVLESASKKPRRIPSEPLSAKVTETSTASSLPQPKVATADWNATVTGIDNRATATKAPVTKAITAGAKRLLKVNKKGLQKMSSFFGVSKKA